jgi:hypothetical protein
MIPDKLKNLAASYQQTFTGMETVLKEYAKHVEHMRDFVGTDADRVAMMRTMYNRLIDLQLAAHALAIDVAKFAAATTAPPTPAPQPGDPAIVIPTSNLLN